MSLASALCLGISRVALTMTLVSAWYSVCCGLVWGALQELQSLHHEQRGASPGAGDSLLPRAALQMYVDVGQVVEGALKRFFCGSGDRERTLGGLQEPLLVCTCLGSIRVLGKVSHTWLCRKSWCFISWSK